MSDPPFTLVIAPTARRQLAEQLPESIAFAAYEFILGSLLEYRTASASSSVRRSMTATARDVAPTACSIGSMTPLTG